MAIKIKEKQIEDFICENPSSLTFLEKATIIGRQVTVPHGIIDILAWREGTTYVIELKAVSLREQDLGQVLRYKYDISMILMFQAHRCLDRRWEVDTPRTRTEDWFVSHFLDFTSLDPYKHGDVKAVLIGKSIPDNVLVACRGADILNRRWSSNDLGETFTFDLPRLHFDPKRLATPPWADKVFDLTEQEAIRWANISFEDELQKLFSPKEKLND